MKSQFAPLDIALISIILLFVALISIFLLEGFHIFTTTVIVDIVYQPNEAYLYLLSLLSLNYNSKTVYETLSYYDLLPYDENFVKFLNESLLKNFDKEPKCLKLTYGNLLIEYKRKDYYGDCSETNFNANIPIFIPYNNGQLVRYLYLNYERWKTWKAY